jgi:hypothetical protein
VNPKNRNHAPSRDVVSDTNDLMSIYYGKTYTFRLSKVNS